MIPIVLAYIIEYRKSSLWFSYFDLVSLYIIIVSITRINAKTIGCEQSPELHNKVPIFK